MKRVAKLGFVLALMVIAFSSCNCYQRMARNREVVSVVCTPEMLTLSDDMVTTDLTISFTKRYFNEDAIVRVTPIIVFEGGQQEGKPFYLQGVRVMENYKVVDNSYDCSITQHVAIPYFKEMDKSKLQLRIEVKCARNKDVDFALINANTGKALAMTELAILALQPDSEAADAIRSKCSIDITTGISK
ncbi:MAG: hypothetical protein SNH88_02165 [Rikenellaceae bacterium]